MRTREREKMEVEISIKYSSVCPSREEGGEKEGERRSSRAAMAPARGKDKEAIKGKVQNLANVDYWRNLLGDLTVSSVSRRLKKERTRKQQE